jgi:CheY-like chemotaxis protein
LPNPFFHNDTHFKELTNVRYQRRQSQIQQDSQDEDPTPSATEAHVEPPASATGSRTRSKLKSRARGGETRMIPSLAAPIATEVPNAIKRKRVLLLDDSPAKRELRAEAMRKLGVDVDCAVDLNEARSWWRVDHYNLVLINMQNTEGHLEVFCDELRTASPAVRLAFLVGKPEYLAHSPNSVAGPQSDDTEESSCSSQAELTEDGNKKLVTCGIMAASRKIAQVRSVSVARTMALRNRPTPPRDLEVRTSRRSEVSMQLRSEAQKTELL